MEIRCVHKQADDTYTFAGYDKTYCSERISTKLCLFLGKEHIYFQEIQKKAKLD